MKRAYTPGLAVILRAIDERRWLRHGLFWVADFAAMVWFVLFGIHSATGWWMVPRRALLLTTMHIAVTYPLLYGVIPALWQKNQRARLPLLLLGWLLFSVSLNYIHRYYILLPLMGKSDIDFRAVFAGTFSITVILISAGVAASLRVYRHWRRQALDNARLTQENFRAELQLLKAQIHPHFLFNTLNNLYALTLRQSDRAPEVVDRLTGLLRFVVEQGDTPQIALSDEVALLRDYLALEQLRYGSRLTLSFETDGISPIVGASLFISPLLLLPLVENAFKHGAAEQLGSARISIALAVTDSCFTCVIANTKSRSVAEAEAPNGIGVRNVQQRLRLLYPRQHHFEIDVRDDTYTVRLTLQLCGQGASIASSGLGSLRPEIGDTSAGWEQPTELLESSPFISTAQLP